jgi:hypothetical protein
MNSSTLSLVPSSSRTNSSSGSEASYAIILAGSKPEGSENGDAIAGSVGAPRGSVLPRNSRVMA